jgi:NAD-dependent deacetylase
MKLSELIMSSKYVTIMTGAGMSTESGMRDFRGVKGMWKDNDPTQLASVGALENNYDEFWNFYKWRIDERNACKPNAGHVALAEMQRMGFIKSIITQNVDQYHQLAGSTKVIELHGNLNVYTDDKGRRRPNVVLFGEMLPSKALEDAVSEIMKTDLLIVLGTSLQVYPANRLPQYILEKGGKIFRVDKEDIGEFEGIKDNIGKVLADTWEEISQHYSKLHNKY